ncbi:MAG: hypothetical protein LBL58_09630 [Tannerellaceae bacterium]|jgi:hypothetical protein|nr:hypothetical protein [Tannerellaceae bacterium]
MMKRVSFGTFCICTVILAYALLSSACKDDKPGKQNPIPSLKEKEVLLNTQEVKRLQDKPKTIKLKIKTKIRRFRSDNFTREQRSDIENYLESMSVQEIELNVDELIGHQHY